jgi:mRNA interferase MazF
VVILTRELVRPHIPLVTVAPIATTVRGLSTEVRVGAANGLDADGVISCDNIVTVPASVLGPQIGVLLIAQEHALTAAIHAAFDLD